MRATRETRPCPIFSAADAPTRRRGGRRRSKGSPMPVTLIALSAALAVLTAAAPVWAHHAFAAEFDANRPIKLTGTVTKMEWINPHTWIHIDVKRPNGTVERWAIEGGPPNALFRRGFNRDSLPAGIEIMVEGFQAK